MATEHIRKKPIRLYMNAIRGNIIQENPCYCGGFVRLIWLDRPRKKFHIVNCFHKSMSENQFKREGWVELKGYFQNG